MATIGMRIRQKRIEKGLSQEELAKRMGYKSKSTINKIEKGINDIVQSNIVKFADVLDTTPSYLMGWDQDEIDAVSEVQESADAYSDSNESELKDVMLEISNIGFSHAEIQRLQAYAHALKEAENAPDEVHKALVELFAKMYKLNLTIEDVEEVYTYAQYISSKNK